MTVNRLEYTYKDVLRFYQKFCPTENDKCWLWKAGTNPDGYGRFYLNGKTIGAHIFAYALLHNSKPPVVRHTCDTRNCVNPFHLVGGTALENNLDTRERNRIPRTTRKHPVRKPRKRTAGSNNGRSVLSERQVRDIRSLYEQPRVSLRQIARRYGVSKTLVQRIVQGIVWRHI